MDWPANPKLKTAAKAIFEKSLIIVPPKIKQVDLI
jgi:hypothetical protein